MQLLQLDNLLANNFTPFSQSGKSVTVCIGLQSKA